MPGTVSNFPNQTEKDYLESRASRTIRMLQSTTTSNQSACHEGTFLVSDANENENGVHGVTVALSAALFFVQDSYFFQFSRIASIFPIPYSALAIITISQ